LEEAAGLAASVFIRAPAAGKHREPRIDTEEHGFFQIGSKGPVGNRCVPGHCHTAQYPRTLLSYFAISQEKRSERELPLRASVPLAHAKLTRSIIGAFYKVFNELGHGYSEKVYQHALAIVLRELGHEAIEERRIKVFFHGALIGEFVVDIVVDGKIIIEIKAGKQIEPWHEA
jgi:GxxExxY protein